MPYFQTVFALHDINGDTFWDYNEIESILLVEIQKMYSENNTEDDMNEREEEIQRMREEFMRRADINKDGLVSRNEYLSLANSPTFTRDEGYKGLDETQVFSEDELKKYEKHREEVL